MDDGMTAFTSAQSAAADMSADSEVVRLVSGIIVNAIEARASHIHIEPARKSVRVRIWVDGVSRNIVTLSKNFHEPVIERWKAMAGLDPNEHRAIQSGHINVRFGDAAHVLDVNVLPVQYGEKVVVHFPCNSDALFGLDKMSLSPESASALRRLASRKSGLILTGGNGGSGKTTLLYSLLLEAKKNGHDGLSLMTIEDPIEYPLEGVSQTQYVRGSGMTIEAALASFSRSDADVILCGRLYDNDSIDACLDLAFSGRRVLSEIRTGGAISVIVNLRSCGIEDYRIAGCLGGLIGQRLLRRIDTTLTEEYKPADEDLKKAGLTRADGPFVCGVGTKENGGTGFRGQIPLVEVVEMTAAFRRLISDGASFEDLRHAAFANGGSLRDDARSRVRAALTTVEEVNRVLFPYAN